MKTNRTTLVQAEHQATEELESIASCKPIDFNNPAMPQCQLNKNAVPDMWNRLSTGAHVGIILGMFQGGLVKNRHFLRLSLPAEQPLFLCAPTVPSFHGCCRADSVD